MIVNAFKQVRNRGHREIFFTNVPQVGRVHTVNICFIVSGSKSKSLLVSWSLTSLFSTNMANIRDD